MEKLIAVTTSAFIFMSAAVPGSAQTTTRQPSAQPQLPTTQDRPGTMGPGMMQQGGMMGGGMMSRGMMGQQPIPAPMMRIIFALMDTDGDGTVSLQEFQAAHERIFKAMDANKDGVLTLEEIESFMRGQTSGETRSGPPQ